MYRWIRICGLFAAMMGLAWLQLGGCSTPVSNEPVKEKPAQQDAGVPEPRPEPQKEAKPEGPPIVAGVGNPCRLSPNTEKGTCPNDQLICVPVGNGALNICLKNCTDQVICDEKGGEACRPALKGFKACKKIAEKGKPCDVEKAIFCNEDYSDPPVYCKNKVCTERPKDGWGLDQRCTEPSGSDEQSDCKKGLTCFELSSNEYRCVKKCSASGDCAKGEICDDKDLGKKVCVIPSKEGGECNKLRRKFCKSDDPVNNPLTCKEGKCESKFKRGNPGDKCIKSIDPKKPEGQDPDACKKGLICLGVARATAQCHNSCDGGCPKGEVCMLQPNLNSEGLRDPKRACVFPVGEGDTCDLTKRRLCRSTKTLFLRCEQGKCIKINAGDRCQNDDACGNSMKCIGPSQQEPDKKYCLLACSPNNPCPDGAACTQAGVCNPVGPKNIDEACVPGLRLGDKRLDFSNLCKGGFSCVRLQQNATKGVCMAAVAQCTKDACNKYKDHVCLPVQGGGLCALDCSKNAQICKTGTKCTKLQKPAASICGPS